MAEGRFSARTFPRRCDPIALRWPVIGVPGAVRVAINLHVWGIPVKRAVRDGLTTFYIFFQYFR